MIKRAGGSGGGGGGSARLHDAVAPRGIDAADDLRRQGERRASKSARLRDTHQRGAGRLVQRRARGRSTRTGGAARSGCKEVPGHIRTAAAPATEFQGVVSSGVRSRTSANVDNGLRDFYRSVRRDDSSDDDAVDNGDDDDANVEGDDPDCSHDAHEISASEQYDLSSVRRRSIIDDIGAIDIVRERLRNVRAGLVNNPLFGPPNGEIFTVGSYSNHHRRHPSFAGRRVLRRCRGNCPPVYLIVSVVFPVPFCY